MIQVILVTPVSNHNWTGGDPQDILLQNRNAHHWVSRVIDLSQAMINGLQVTHFPSKIL